MGSRIANTLLSKWRRRKSMGQQFIKPPNNQTALAKYLKGDSPCRPKQVQKFYSNKMLNKLQVGIITSLITILIYQPLIFIGSRQVSAATPAFATLSSTAIYAIHGGGSGSANTISTLNLSTGALTSVHTAGITSSAAMGMDATTNTLYYTERTTSPNTLRRYDGTTESGSLGGFSGTSSGTPMLRIGFTNGTGYAIASNNEMFSFTNAVSPTITSLGTVNFVGTSPSGSTASGDIAFDGYNRGWAIFGNSLYRMDLNVSPPNAYPIGQITVSGSPLSTGSFTVGSIAFDTTGDLYIAAVASSGTSSNIYRVSVDDATATQVGSSLATVVSDLASGNHPFIAPNIVATKSVSPTTNVRPGDTLTYTVEIENTGNSPTVVTAFTDTLPTGTTYVASSATLNGTSLGAVAYPFNTAYTINGRTASSGTIKSGNANRATITYQVTVNTTSPPASVVNQGVVTYLDGPPAGVSTTTTTSTVDSPVAGYKSVKLTTDADSNGVASPGDTLTWTVSYKNTTAFTVSNVQINDHLPANVTINSTGGQSVAVSGSGTAATKNTSYTGATGGAASNTLAAGATLGNSGVITVTITTTINSGFSGTLSNQATATGDSVPGSGTLSDNIDSTTASLPSGVTVPAGSITQTQVASIDPTTVTVPAIPLVTLVKSCPSPADCSSATQLPGTELTYRIVFSNIGNGQAQQLVILDPIPTETDFKLSSVTSNLGSSGLTITTEYSNDYLAASPGSATWTYTPSSSGGGADAGYDRNVKAIRWRVTAGNLSPTAPNNTGDVGFTVRIK